MAFSDDDRNLYALVITVSFACFAVCFAGAWLISGKFFFPKVFNRLTYALKADWCSRVNSTIHGVIVVIGFIVTLSITDWDSKFRPERYSLELRSIRCFMSVSLGYFAFDLFVVAGFRVPLWYVFVGHHLFASTPFYLHLFVDRCDFGTLELAAYLCVEFATVFLNVQSWCETIVGHRNTALYRTLFGLTYASWFVSRLALPVFLLTIWWRYLLLDEYRHQFDLGCLVVNSLCGHVITLFCVSVFAFVLTPELIAIVKGTDRASQVQHAIEKSHEMGRHHPEGGTSANEPTADDVFSAADEAAAAAMVDEDPVAANAATAEAGGNLPSNLHSVGEGSLSLADAASAVRASIAAHGG